MSLSIAGSFSLCDRYAEKIEKAGGVPLCLPPQMKSIKRALAMFDGFLFIGGKDYHPKHYGGEEQPPDELIEERRDAFDIALARRILRKTSLPVLAICGGEQLLNIACGGSLVQDIKAKWASYSGTAPLEHQDGSQHSITIAPDSTLFQIIGKRHIITNSFHHQAINPHGLGKELRIVATSDDGIVEAVENTHPIKRFIIGLQWHPERMEDKSSSRLFTSFVRAARNFGSSKHPRGDSGRC